MAFVEEVSTVPAPHPQDLQCGPSRRAVVTFMAALLPSFAVQRASAAVPGLNALDPLVRPSLANRRATSAVFIATALAGSRVVAVGEAGTVLCSDDDGKTWQQAEVPVSVTLTGVCFVDDQRGWAVGHSGVILSTTDGGRKWARQLDSTSRPALKSGAPGSAGDPLLDVYFSSATEGFAVGAFGLALHTADGGRTWEDCRERIPNPDGSHLYAVRAAGSALFIVGERGTVFVSSDGGQTFAARKSPYEGSFFGAVPTSKHGLIVFGLRGHVFHSKDQGNSWTEIKAGSGNAWLGASLLNDGRVALVSQAGEIALIDRDDVTVQILPNHQPPLNAVVATSAGQLIVAGMRGVSRVSLTS